MNYFKNKKRLCIQLSGADFAPVAESPWESVALSSEDDELEVLLSPDESVALEGLGRLLRWSYALAKAGRKVNVQAGAEDGDMLCDLGLDVSTVLGGSDHG